MNIEQARFNMIEQQIRPGMFWIRKSSTCFSSSSARISFLPPTATSLSPTWNPARQRPGHADPEDRSQAAAGTVPEKDRQGARDRPGSGHMAALLAAPPRRGHIESRPELQDSARANLERAGIANVTLEAQRRQRLACPRPLRRDPAVRRGPVRARSAAQATARWRRLAAIVGEAPSWKPSCHLHRGSVYNTVNLFETVAPALDGFAAKEGFSF
jgi:protein-L-isoaspartate(D-aspartate) O-methyltransferase